MPSRLSRDRYLTAAGGCKGKIRGDPPERAPLPRRGAQPRKRTHAAAEFRAQESGDRGNRRRWVVDLRKVARGRHQLRSCIRNLRREQPGQHGREEPVVSTPQHESLGGNLWQDFFQPRRLEQAHSPGRGDRLLAAGDVALQGALGKTRCFADRGIDGNVDQLLHFLDRVRVEIDGWRALEHRLESRGIDQDQATNMVGVGSSEGCRDPAANGIADDIGPGDTVGIEQRLDCLCLHRHREIIPRLGGLAEAEHVDRKDPMRSRQRRRNAGPVLLVATDTVNDDHVRSGSVDAIGQRLVTDRQRLRRGGCLRHGGTSLCREYGKSTVATPSCRPIGTGRRRFATSTRPADLRVGKGERNQIYQRPARKVMSVW